MRKKIFLTVMALLILCFFFLWWAPINFGIQKEIEIASPIDHVTGQFTDLRNWRNWNPELHALDTASFNYSRLSFQVNSILQASTHQFTILKNSAAYILVKEQTGNTKEYHSIYAFSDSLGSFTRVIWIRALSPFQWIKETLFPRNEMENGLAHLKNFIEDPNQYYGFPIAIAPIEDTLVLTSTTRVLKKDLIKTILSLNHQIRQNAASNHIVLDQPLMASINPIQRDSIQVTAGIPVSEVKPINKDLAYLQMPKAGRMVIINYVGSYSGLAAAYTAMDKYIAEKRLHRAAIAYEKFLSGPPIEADNRQMTIKLCSPVF
jgi:effector-binding domain-containing protein